MRVAARTCRRCRPRPAARPARGEPAASQARYVELRSTRCGASGQPMSNTPVSTVSSARRRDQRVACRRRRAVDSSEATKRVPTATAAAPAARAAARRGGVDDAAGRDHRQRRSRARSAATSTGSGVVDSHVAAGLDAPARSARRRRPRRPPARRDAADLHEHAAAGGVQRGHERRRLAPREGHDRHPLGDAERRPARPARSASTRLTANGASVDRAAGRRSRAAARRAASTRPGSWRGRRRRRRRGTARGPAAPPIGACMTPAGVPSTSFTSRDARAARPASSSAAAAASLPLLPTAPPARASAWARVVRRDDAERDRHAGLQRHQRAAARRLGADEREVRRLALDHAAQADHRGVAAAVAKPARRQRQLERARHRRRA